MDSRRAFDGLLVTEIFHSIQGETSLSGLRFAFIRLTGCNLRCTYCDSAYAFKGGKKFTIDEIMAEIKPYSVKHVLLTGGEPLLQRQTPELARRLRDSGYTVSIETHGEVSIAPVVADSRVIMDIKTPSSKMNRGNFEKNLPLLKPTDEIKFVIGSIEDYEFAKGWVNSGRLKVNEILFSPVIESPGSPEKTASFNLKWLTEQMLADRLPVRIQMQLHKLVWGADRKGV